MNRCLCLTFFLMIIPSDSSQGQGITDQVRTWFLTQYAPLWENIDEMDPSLITEFWVENFRDHPVDMDSSIWENTEERWQRNLDRYRAEGLHRSEVVEIRVEMINNHAALIQTKWIDYTKDGHQLDEPYCGMFIAGTFEDQWKFTNYFTVNLLT